ncbi:MAG: hypothetical protein QXK12_07780 [Candidatus Nezhaarchaeales archaeon]
MQNTFMAYWSEFREFAKRTDENFKLILDRYGEISNKLTIILETLVKESSETREKLSKALNLLTKLVEKLTEKY